MDFILASSNEHKAEELTQLFGGVSTVKPAPSKIEVEEDGDTFQENAYKKAYAYFKQFKTPTLADDSGLIVDALPEHLGVKSARFAPEYPNYKDKNAELIKMLHGEERTAHFACVLCFIMSEDEVYFFEGRVHGTIGETQSGDGGFGYDPVFYPDGCDGKSMAQVPEWKMINSHRAKAAKSALKFLQETK